MGTRIPKPAIDFNPPVYSCRRATKEFTLTGNIEKPFWEDAPFTDYFADIEGYDKTEPRYKTRAKMLWDDENMYFGAILEGEEIWGTLEERDCVIFHDNDFEIFIDPDSDTHQYFEFEMNAKNTVWDLFLTKPYRDFGMIPLNGFDFHGLQTAVYIDGELNNPNANNKRWMVEVVIPFEALKEAAPYAKKPVTGDYYRVNFSRVQWLVDKTENGFEKRKNPATNAFYPEDNWVWAPTGLINIHYPEMWGFVFFTENGEACEIPEEEKMKWELRKMYYQEYEYYDNHGCFTDNPEDLTGTAAKEMQVSIQTTKHTFEITCPNKENNAQLSIHGDGRTYRYGMEK